MTSAWAEENCVYYKQYRSKNVALDYENFPQNNKYESNVRLIFSFDNEDVLPTDTKIVISFTTMS